MESQMKKQKRVRRSAPQARGELRRKQLVQAAKMLLETHYIQDITYNDIAEYAEIPLPSCYHFFQNKLDLVKAVSEDFAIDYRKAVFGKEINPEKIQCWGDIIDIMTDHSGDFFRSQPAARQVWLSGYVPPEVSIKTREREFTLSIQLKELVGTYFQLPDIPQIDTIFYITHEIGDRILSLSQTLHSDVTNFMIEESKRAKKGYLLNYLPPVLSRVVKK